MTIAVMSDLHDNVTAWGLVVKQLQHHAITRLMNCGDTCAPSMLRQMATDFSGQIDTVFGNVADRTLEAEVAKSLSNVTHHGDRGIITIEGKRIFLNHFPQPAEEVALSGDVDLACHGHTHLKRWEQHGDSYLLNPGTAGGMFQYPSIALVDLQTMTHQFINLTL